MADNDDFIADYKKSDLFNELLACLIQSSLSMDETVRALAKEPLHAEQVNMLNDSLESVRVLLTKVTYMILSYCS
jgi:hypothetical protein